MADDHTRLRRSALGGAVRGDDQGKDAARQLITDLGCEPLDAGDLRQARHLEAMAIVTIRLLFGGYDPYSVFAFVSSGRIGQPFTSR